MIRFVVMVISIVLLLAPSVAVMRVNPADAMPCEIIQSIVIPTLCIGGGGGGGMITGNIVGKVVNSAEEHDPFTGAAVSSGTRQAVTDYNGNFKLVGFSSNSQLPSSFSVVVSYTYNGATYTTSKQCKVAKAGDNDCGLLTISGPTPISRIIHKLVNEERGKAGLGELKWNENLAKKAREWSENMASTGRLEHSNLKEYLKDVCPSYKGENIAEQFTYNNSGDRIARLIVDAWMNSPDHRANILGTNDISKNFKSEGIGVAWTDAKVYVTEHFCG